MRAENSPSVLFNFSILALSGATRQLSQRESPWHGGKVSGIAQRRPLGGAGERSEPEGVSAKTPPVCCADSPLWDGAFGMAGKFPVKP